MQSVKLAIFLSGAGSNARQIITHFENHHSVSIGLVLVTRENSPVIEFCRDRNVRFIICSNKEADSPQFLLNACFKFNIDFIILAGFLRKIPIDLVRQYPQKIINIHPSLLPKFGGLGMYGRRVHQAVLEANEKITGITIHFVNEAYDKGEIIEQHSCEISSCDNVDAIEEKVKGLEHSYYAPVIEKLLNVVYG